MFRQQQLWLALVFVLCAVLVLPVTAGVAGAASRAQTTSCDQTMRFDRKAFSKPTKIDNQWLPLVPGTQFTLDGFANNGGAPVPHRVVLTVTDLTKVVNDVRAVVLWDVDLNDGEVAETELAFVAQDNAGNVWNLGEYPEEWEGGKFVGAPATWIAGVAGAKAGLHMLANPQPGTPSYLQGLAPKIDFLDCGQVFQTGQSVTVPFRSYGQVLVTNEWSPLSEGGGIQRKFYAPRVGNVQITAVDDPEGETLKLVKIEQLKRQALADARQEALKLDRHAYVVSDVYRGTMPAR